MIRFAPTLESDIHIGNSRILFCNYLFAKQANLGLIFRVDYKAAVSAEREREQALKTYNLCKGVGIEFNKIIYQRERKELYSLAYNRLKNMGLIETIGGVSYLSLGDTDSPVFSYYDLVFGEMSKKRSLIKNVIVYSDLEDSYFYNFTSTVDDFFEGVTHVIRGSDHLDNTFVQALMFKRLQEAFPEKQRALLFCHVPLCLSKSGKKVSKTEDVSSLRLIDILHNQNIMPITLIHYLLFGSEKTYGGVDEYVKNFSFKKIGRALKKIDFSEIEKLNKKFLNRLNSSSLFHQLNAVGVFQSPCFLETFAPFSASVSDLLRIRGSIDFLESATSAALYEGGVQTFSHLLESLGLKGFEKEVSSYLGRGRIGFFAGHFGEGL